MDRSDMDQAGPRLQGGYGFPSDEQAESAGRSLMEQLLADPTHDYQTLKYGDVIEGTVMRSGTRVRITAQLIRVGTEQHVWAEDFEGNMQDVLALQDDVARAIANKIQRELAPGQQVRVSARRQMDPEAYEAYLRGLEKFATVLRSFVDEITEYWPASKEQTPGFSAVTPTTNEVTLPAKTPG